MKRLIGILALITVGIWALSAGPSPRAIAAPVTPGLAASITSTEMVPGQAGYVYVTGGYPLKVTATMDDQPLSVFWTGSGYEALFSFGLEAAPGQHRLSVQANDPNTGDTLTQSYDVTVNDFTFRNEYVPIPFKLQALLDPDVNQAELDKLAAVYAGRTQPSSFDWPFTVPVPGGIITSRYGSNRVYNGGVLTTRHTGMDFRRAIGEPIQATATGVVVLAETLLIRGNVIILDHGYGVFSQYAHLSQILVQPGQIVRHDEIIGLAGATGRTNGPHLHFEIIVNGNPVDPLKWLELAPGFVPLREATPRPQETPAP